MSGLRSFWPFYGGKWRLAPRYPAPLFGTIVEPFAGAAGYALRYADRGVVLVERDPTIVCENVGATWLPFDDFAPFYGARGAKRPDRRAEAAWFGGAK